MLKSNALYRDGSKLSQPLSSLGEDIFESIEESEDDSNMLLAEKAAEKLVYLHRAQREGYLNAELVIRKKAVIGGHKVIYVQANTKTAP